MMEASKWSEYKDDVTNQLQSENTDAIDVAIGQARLLSSKKLNQFSDLVDKFENETSSQPIFEADLEGFWNMVYQQIENCDIRFAKLEKLKQNDWVEEHEVKATAAIKQKTVKNVVKKRRNDIKDLIARANAFQAQQKLRNDELKKEMQK